VNGLVEFLRARLDEDERRARRMAGGGHLEGARRWIAGEANADGVRTEAGTPVTRFSWPYEMEHIARHDPQRVLADVAAKRAIVQMYENAFLAQRTDLTRYNQIQDGAAVDVLGVAVRHLAAVYVDHPAYRQRWAP
jgi:hypothetical protein